jgi:hypothetical protein
MKILRHLVLFAFAAFIVVSCRKSDISPRKCGGNSDSKQTETTTNTPSDLTQSSGNATNNESARSSVTDDGLTPLTPEESTFTDDNSDSVTEPTDVSGSGDDDRDGGERKKRKR